MPRDQAGQRRWMLEQLERTAGSPNSTPGDTVTITLEVSKVYAWRWKILRRLLPTARIPIEGDQAFRLLRSGLRKRYSVEGGRWARKTSKSRRS